MPDEFGGIEIQEPETDEFGGIAIQGDNVPRGTISAHPTSLPRTESVFDRALRFLKPGITPPSGIAIGGNLQASDVSRVAKGIYEPVQRGMQAAGEVAHEALAPAASEFLTRTGIDPSSTPEHVINLPRLTEKDFPGSPAPGIAAGLQNLAAGTTESLGQPENAAFLLASGGEGLIGRAASLAFAEQQFTQLPDQAQNAMKVLADPKASKAQKTEAIGQPLVSSFLTATMVKHGLTRPLELAEQLGKALNASEPQVSGREATPITRPGSRMAAPSQFVTQQQGLEFAAGGEPIRRSFEESRVPPEAPEGQPTYPPSGLGRPEAGKLPEAPPPVRPHEELNNSFATKPRTSSEDAIAAGLKATSVNDLQALLDERKQRDAQRKALLDQVEKETDLDKKLNLLTQGVKISTEAQLMNEAIESATKYTKEELLPQKAPLDWRDNPEVKDWLIKNAGSLVNEEAVPELVQKLKGETEPPAKPEPIKGLIAGTELEKWADEAKERIRNEGRLRAFGDPESLAIAIVKGAAHIERGLTEFSKWSAAMLKEYGEAIRPHLQKIFAQSKGLRSKAFENQTTRTETTPPPPKPPTQPPGTPPAPEKTPQTPTGIRNSIVDQERQKRGLPAAMDAARRTFGEVWDRAVAIIDRDPVAQDRLINSLMNKPRALTDVEDAMLLHRQVDLQNQHDTATRDLAEAYDAGREEDVATARVRVAELADKLFDLYNVGKTSGTETARGLSARRMLANQAFSLANMVVQKRAAKGGRRLTPEETTSTENSAGKISKAQQELDRHLAQKTRTSTTNYDIQTERLRANVEREKNRFNLELAADRLAQRPAHVKAMDWLTKWRRAFVLSSPITLAKLVAASIQRMTLTPVEELVGSGLEKLLPSVASKTGREGGLNIKAEARALTKGFTQGMKDSWDVLRTGRSSLDEVYGRAAGYPPAVSDFFGHVHGALKSFTKRNEFARSFEKRAAAAMASGIDVSDPAVQMQLGIESYKDANRSIFQQDNRVVAAYKALIGSLERKPTLPSKAVATALKVALPVVKIPTNIVAETFQMATGSVTGSVQLGRAFARGIDKLSQQEADIIMRNLKKGSLGAAVLALGYLNADVIGGYYQPGKKRDPRDVKAGRIRLFGEEVPSWLLHHPLLETLQIGATARRVAEGKFTKGDPEQKGIGWGLFGAGVGALEEVPFVRESSQVGKAFTAPDQRAFLGELAKSIVIPQGVQWWAALRDVDRYGQPISRKPKTLTEHIKTGIPGLREEVPKKK